MAWLVLGSLVGAAGACATPSVDDSDSTAGAVVSSNVQASFTIATTALTGALAKAQRATGALIDRYGADTDGRIATDPDGKPLRSTCGVTFIDRTHAITAGHCVGPDAVADISNETVSVDLYDVSPDLDWKAAAKLRGTFPSYTHERLEGKSGYDVTTLTCKVAARCLYGDENCPQSVLDDGADIALLTCDELPSDREPVAVADSDDERGPVRVFWFHEVYDAPTGSRADDFFAHYTSLESARPGDNFHYFDGGRNDLLPLISADWRNGSPRRRVGASGTIVWTDLFGCHGTSGSGVMTLQDGEYVLLGPTANSAPWGNTRLCTDPATQLPGKPNIAYTALRYVKAMASLASR